MARATVNTLVIDGRYCTSTRTVNCNKLHGGHKAVWVLNDDGLPKIDYEDNGGTAAYVIYEGDVQIVITEDAATLNDDCCCVV